MKLVGKVEIETIDKIKSGKVREMFSFEDKVLIVTTDRISAFDFILPTLIPYKGAVLNKISIFWFDYLKDVIENHLIETDFEKFPKIFKKYKEGGKIGNVDLPSGLKMCDKLPEPIFTPTTKAEVGHDLSITLQKAKR